MPPRAATKSRSSTSAQALPRGCGKPDLLTAAAGTLRAYKAFRASGNPGSLHSAMTALRDALEPDRDEAGQPGQLVLAALCEAPGSSVVMLARKTGIYEDKLRRVLTGLIAPGLAGRSRRPGSKVWDWYATPPGEAATRRP